jgi:hypothetical protein
MPRSAADLKHFGAFIKWITNDPAVLATLHDGIVRLVEQAGISGVVVFAHCVKRTKRLMTPFGERWRDVVRQTQEVRAVPDEVFKYIKGM